MKQYDAQSIADRITDKLKTKLDNKQILFVGANRRLIDSIAEEMADEALEVEYLTREAKWSLAREFSSMLAQTEFFPYKPHRKIGSKGSLKVSSNENFTADYPHDIVLPKYFRFANGNDLSFVSRSEVVISAGQEYASVPVVQGIPRTKTVEITEGAYSEGTQYIRITINNSSIENDIFSVEVNGTEWEEIDNLRLSEDGEQQVYRTRNKQDFSGVVFEFGNDIFGKKLEYGDTVVIRYVETKGGDGNVLSTNNITNVLSTAVDVEDNEVTLYVTNEEAIVGGSTYESIESIRANAPQSYKTGDRAITSEDYQSIIFDTGLVDKVIVWGEKEVNEDQNNPPGTFLSTEENLVYISGFSIDENTTRGTTLTAGGQSTIRNTLNDVKPPTDIIQFLDTDFLYVNFYITCFVADRQYSPEQVRGLIRSALSSAYNLDDEEFRRNLYFSDYFQVIQDVPGVRNHRTTIDFTKFLRFRSAYEFYLDLGVDSIKPNTFKLYVKTDADTNWTHVASDDGNGNIVGELIDPDDTESASYELPNATLDYSTGLAGDIIITSGLTQGHTQYEIKVDFDLTAATEGNLLLTKRQQIFSYLESEIDVSIV